MQERRDAAQQISFNSRRENSVTGGSWFGFLSAVALKPAQTLDVWNPFDPSRVEADTT
jgi:hypothetical protein